VDRVRHISQNVEKQLANKATGRKSTLIMAEEKQDVNQLMTNIFGDSDDDEELEKVENVFSSDDDEIQLPSFKKKAVADDQDEYQEKPKPPKPKVQKKRKESVRKKVKEPEAEEDVPLSPEAAKKRQAQKDIDDILQRMKPLRQKRDLQSEVEIDDMIQQISTQMRDAAYHDQEFNKQGQPAIAKLKLLPSVMIHLSKVHWHPQLLEQNILECVKFWLEPLSDGSLPSLDIQQQLLDVMKIMPVETHHLRSSLIGRVLMFYTKCERVQPDVKRKCEVLIRRWMRPILGKSADHRHLQVKQVRYTKLM
jgi:transcription factor SPN1